MAVGQNSNDGSLCNLQRWKALALASIPQQTSCRRVPVDFLHLGLKHLIPEKEAAIVSPGDAPMRFDILFGVVPSQMRMRIVMGVECVVEGGGFDVCAE